MCLGRMDVTYARAVRITEGLNQDLLVGVQWILLALSVIQTLVCYVGVHTSENTLYMRRSASGATPVNL